MASHSPKSWTDGYGVISHKDETIERLTELLGPKISTAHLYNLETASPLLKAADKLTNAAMWMVVHMTYASQIDLKGDDLPAATFKENPQGHTGGSLNMVPAYVGYLTANALSGHTRAWTLGQGHCVAAIEAVNALVSDVSPEQIGRYDQSETGLSQLAKDFYSYALTADGRPGVPLGSHVSPHTAGGLSEGGYLGFASTQYIHMPLLGERLIAFLSDGAFEEQRGSDWAPRWWRAEDCGLAVPIMILNGRRIEQRTEIIQEGGVQWLETHLRHSGFDPIVIDGHDPLAYTWAILEAEARLIEFSKSSRVYPAPLPYIIARCVKGYGFPGAGTNRSHNLPLIDNPRFNNAARISFNTAAKKLFVPWQDVLNATKTLKVHEQQSRTKESQNALATRHIELPKLQKPNWIEFDADGSTSPMEAIDEHFMEIIKANPQLRPRVGNPDELRSNHMSRTLDQLKHRVNQPEPGNPEAIDGAVITALNEEAVIGATLGNKGGINLAVSYEAFAMKMLGALRQDIIFSRHKKEIGQPPGWLSVPLIVTSHTWENSKNEQSHQDPTLPEALFGEMSDTARVIFPVDSNSAIAALDAVYRTRGNIACLVVPKQNVPERLTGSEAEKAIDVGGIHVFNRPETADIQIVSIGAYQASEALRAADRLESCGFKACVTAIVEPGRFRIARDEIEGQFTIDDPALETLFPSKLPRIILSHTRPEPILGLLRRLDGGPMMTHALGYISRGGTFDTFGLTFANRCTWAHVLGAAAGLLNLEPSELLSSKEILAINDQGDPQVLNTATLTDKS